MIHRAMVLALSAIVLVAGLRTEAGAQQTGRLEGRLTRPDGTGLSGATVTVPATRVSTVTDAEGRFVLEPVPAGTISVVLSLGVNVMTVADVRVEQGRGRLDRTVDWQVGFAETITVFAASRRTERFFDAPAAVNVITDRAIEDETAHAQLPKLLESIPGVELAQSGIFDFNVNIRGLNSALTRRVLTLVDGRDPASVLIGAQEWAAFGLPLSDLSRIEVVRGPGAALYGTNAFNGVIDITTRPPHQSPGGSVEATAGEAASLRGAARHAGALGTETFYRVHATYGRTDDFFKSRTATVEYPGLPAEVLSLQRDRTEVVSAGARLDRRLANGAFLTGEGGWAHTDGNVLLTGAGRIQNTGAHRPWLRSSLTAPRWRLSGYFDGRFGEMASLTAGNTIVDRSMKASVEGQRRYDYGSGKGELVVGASYRFLRADTRDDAGRSTILRDVEQAHERSIFAQLDHQLSSAVKAVVAARVDGSSLHGAEVSPKAALVFSASPTHTVRVSYGHAFQTGSFVHYFTRTAAAPPVSLAAIEAALQPALGGVPLGFGSVPILALGNERLEVERVDSLEAGYSGVLKRNVLIGVSYYYNRVNNLITPLIQQVGTELGRINPAYQPYAPPAALGAPQQALVLATLRASLPAPLYAIMSNDFDGAPIFAAASYTNLPRATLQGAELSVRYFAGNRFGADFGYAALKFTPDQQLQDPLVTANAPPHKLTAGLTLTSTRFTASVRARWSDAFFWNGGVFRGSVPAAFVVDLNGRYRLRRRTAIQVNIANLFDNEHHEIFGGDLLQRRALVSVVQTW